MKISFIGAGKAGCSLGKYFAEKGSGCGLTVSGYYSLEEADARWAASFTGSHCFAAMGEAVDKSDAIIVSTPDGAITKVWESLRQEHVSGKMICHLSGSLSSDVFSGAEDLGAYPVSIHPMFAFSNRESVYQQLQQASFTLEGHPRAVLAWQEVFEALGNGAAPIDRDVKAKYHGAASLLSNHVLAVLATGYELLEECGFSSKEARSFSQFLVKNNVEHAIKEGCVKALTGPVERGDIGTVEKHLSVMGEAQQELYRACGRKLAALARQKHPGQDYGPMEDLLNQ
ncbi:MAG: DUF2520 domain-containing protein [Lachnospiraceae bacterium]|nr:DUF2520 domain-containing protein [Lachnospiraceae bacterium]